MSLLIRVGWVGLATALFVACAKAEGLNSGPLDGSLGGAAGMGGAAGGAAGNAAGGAAGNATGGAAGNATGGAAGNATGGAAGNATGGAAGNAGGTGGDASVDVTPDVPIDTQPDAVFTETGLVAFWKFEEQVGLVFDMTANTHDGSVEGSGVSRGLAGHAGNGIGFAGLGGRVRVPSDAGLNLTTAATIEFWVKLGSVAQGTILTRGTGSNDDHVRVVTSQGNLNAAFGRAGQGATSVISAPNVLTSGAWKHVAIVNDGSTLKLFVGGKLLTSATGGKLGNISSDLCFGKGTAATDKDFVGSLDELKWYTLARTDQEICADAGGSWASVDGAFACQ